MDQRASEIRLAQWEQIVLEGNQASVTKREWCRQNGISEKSFFYWQRKIRLKALGAKNTASAIVPVPAADSSRPTFVELPFPDGPDDKKPDTNVLPEVMYCRKNFSYKEKSLSADVTGRGATQRKR